MTVSKPKRIGWLSRHDPTKRQLEALEREFPGHVLLIDHKAFSGADEIVQRVKRAQLDEIVVVAPTDVKRALIERGVHPIVAEMKLVPCKSPEAEVRIKNRCYRFIQWQRLERVNMHFTALSPRKNGK